MADVKLTALSEVTAPTGDDLLYLVDNPAGSPNSGKASVTNVSGAANLGVSLVDPTTLSWSWVNQGSSTIAETNRRCYLTPQAGANAYSTRIRVKTAPTPPYTVTVLWSFCAVDQNYAHAGLMFRESSTGKFHSFCNFFYSGNRYLYSRKHASATDAGPTNYAFNVVQLPNPLWMRIADNNTSRICSVSPDGVNWIAYHTVGRLDYLTGGADQVGFFADPYAANQWPQISILSWAEA